MVNNEAGAFLNITPDVLKKLDSFDEKLEKIEKHAHTAADALKNGFGSVVMDTSKLENAITSLAKKIDAIKGNPFEGAGKGAEETTRKTTSLNESLSRAADLLNRISSNKIGEGSFSNLNISGLKQGYSDLKKYVENMDLSKPQQKAAVEAMRYMKMELDEQRKTDEQRAQSAEKAAQRKETADRRAAKAAEDARKAQEYAQRTTPQGALDYSKNTKSLQQNVQAIEYLKKARLSLNTTDANYKSTIEQINQAIAKHNQALTEAGVKSQQLVRHQSNLMNTTEQLKRKLALVFSVSQIEGYVKKLANVRGEFELQQRSLQAILQNKSQADEIFNKTVQLAVKSPYKIKELVSFTKQLAAYRIESNKLYDTTKRLADVSAGLGVDMGRLILAYGQVKAAAYLRGTEVRQFTEAGINMYGELQKLFKERDQADYTTAQIVDMISKRKVTFEDVEEIFKRLTDKEGIFYNMQEIQAETLQGKISNLQDSIDVMLNSIGKANEDTLKGAIDTAKLLLDNWETVVEVAKTFGAVIGAMGLTVWSKKLGVANTNVAILGLGIKRLTATLTALKTTFMSSLPTAGIFLAIEALTELIRVNSEYRKAMSESTTNYFKNRVIVSEIDKESESDIKSALSKLIKAMNNEGFEIEIKANISEDEARKEFDNYKQMYEKFLYDMLVIEQKYAENKKKGWLIGDDDIDTDAQEYKESLSDFIAKGEKIRSVLLQVSEQSKILTKTQVEQFKELAAGPNKGENIINYYERLAKALEEVGYKADEAYGGRISKQNILGGYHQTQGMWGIGIELDRQIAGFSTSFITMNKDLEEFKREAISIFGEVREDMSDKEKNELKIKIDKTAIEKGWDNVIKDIVYQEYDLKLKVDVDEVEKEVDGLDVIFKKWFSTHTYKLGINYGDLGNKDIFKGFLEQGDEMAAAYKKAELSAKRLKNAADTVFNQKQSGLSKEQFENAFGMIEFISKEQLLKYYEELAKANKQAAIDAGWTEDEEKKSRAERDIWAERISVLKEMQSRYEKLKELMGETRAIEETRYAFKGALDFTQMGEVIKPEDIIPTKQGMIDALEKLLKQIPNDVKNAAKKTGLEKEIAELKIGIQQDYLKEQLEKTKKNIEDMFNGLDLHQKLKDAGLSEAEVQQLFPGLAKTLDDVEKGIEEEFDKLRDVNGQLGETEQKDYEERIAKLNQQRIKESQDLVVELTKNYKTQLSDQMQLDTWYIKERSKIYSKAYDEQTKTFKDVLTPEMQKQYEANLNKEYQKRTSENTWKNFQATDFYIDMFENLDRASTASIKGMLERLQDLRSSLKDLPADQVRAIINQMEKLQETIVSRNPFKTFGENIKAYNEALLELKKVDEYGNLTNESTTYEELEKSQSENAKKLADIEAQKNAENSKLEVLKQQKAEGELYHTLSKKELDDLEKKIADQQKLTDELILQAEIQGKITKAEADQLRNVRNLKKLSEMSAEEIVNGIGNTLSQIGSELPNIASNLENVFGTMSDGLKDTIDTLSEVTSGLGSAANGIGQIMTANGNPFQIISGGLQAIGGITKAIGALFAIGDKKKEREIQRQIENVEALGKAYDELKEKMDAAWESADLHKQTQNTIANLDDQIASYKAMIKAEEDKKKTDKERIEEWQEAIEDLQKTKQEIMQQEQMDLGGIGGESEYKSAAENFVQAWMDAFNETGKGIEGLKESFDDMIENLVVKQATMRLAQNRLKKIFDEIDKSVTEESAGGINLTKEELENINSIADSALKGLNEDLLALMETLGYKGKGKTAELSALQQGITQMSEETAGELQALLNSIRWFVSQQTSDTTAIRNLLEARYGLESQNSEANPMLIELRAQTGYLEQLSDYIGRVFAPSPNSKGAGLRVFIG